MIRIAICDDESIWLKSAESQISAYAESHNTTAIAIKTFSSGIDLLRAVESDGAFDLYVLDVVMPDKSGIDTGIALRETDKLGKIIYLTSSPDFAVESYIADAFNYLLKPIEKERLFAVLDKAIGELSQRKERCIKVKTSSDVHILTFDEILYVELCKKALVYYLISGETIESVSQRDGFSTCVAPLCEDERFVLCGASTCVNLFYIKSIDKESVTFKNGTQIFLPKKACAVLRTEWLDFWFDDLASADAEKRDAEEVLI